jgi:hypothetical protein
MPRIGLVDRVDLDDAGVAAGVVDHDRGAVAGGEHLVQGVAEGGPGAHGGQRQPHRGQPVPGAAPQVVGGDPAARHAVLVQHQQAALVALGQGAPGLRRVGAVGDGGPAAQLDVPDPAQAQPLERGAAADEVGHELVGRIDQDPLRGVVLGDVRALAQDRDPVAHLDRLVDVVGDEHDGLLDLGLQPEELVLQPVAGDRVDGTERLVHQHDVRVGAHRPGHPDPLALPAGELLGVPVAVLVGVPSRRSG